MHITPLDTVFSGSFRDRMHGCLTLFCGHRHGSGVNESSACMVVQVLEVLNELIDEMDLAEEAIVASAVQHIHSNEVIMTFGLSQTTLKFLVRAAERRTFQARFSLQLLPHSCCWPMLQVLLLFAWRSPGMHLRLHRSCVLSVNVCKLCTP